MEFILTDTNERKEIVVRPWTGSGYGPDCFSDLECNAPQLYKKEEDGTAYCCTSAEYDELKEFWTEEIRCMNDREAGHIADYTDLTGDELVIIAD